MPDQLWAIVASAISTGLLLKIFEWAAKRADIRVDQDRERTTELKSRIERLEAQNSTQSIQLEEWRTKYYEERLKVREMELKVQYLMERDREAKEKQS